MAAIGGIMSGFDLLLPARVASPRPQADPGRPQRQGEADAAASDFASALLGALAGVPGESTVVAARTASAEGEEASVGTSIANTAAASSAVMVPGAPLLTGRDRAVPRSAAVETGTVETGTVETAAVEFAAVEFAAVEFIEGEPAAIEFAGIPVHEAAEFDSEGCPSPAPTAPSTMVGSAVGEVVDVRRPASATSGQLAQPAPAAVAPQPSGRVAPDMTAELAPLRITAEPTLTATLETRRASTPAPLVDAAGAFAAQPTPRVVTTAPAAAVTAPTSAPTAPNLAGQLSGTVLALARRPDGTHTVTLSVNPEALGPVTVRAIVDPTGIRIELHVAEHAREALRAVLPELRRDLTGFASGARLDLADGAAGSGGGGGAGDASRSPDRDTADSQHDGGGHSAAREHGSTTEFAGLQPAHPDTPARADTAVHALTAPVTPNRATTPGAPTFDILT